MKLCTVTEFKELIKDIPMAALYLQNMTSLKTYW